MISLTHRHPLTEILYNRNKLFTPRIYQKEDFMIRRNRLFKNRIFTLTGAASFAVIAVAGIILMNMYT